MQLTDDFATLARQFDTMSAGVRESSGVVGAFSDELNALRTTMLYTDKEVSSLSRSFGKSLRNAFDDVVFDGAKLSDALRDVGRSMSDAAYNAAMKPIQNAAGGFIAGSVNNILSKILPFADGASFSQGRVIPFASGGVVSSPTTFPMRGATGLMGEAGPEAIMPLTRAPDGRLGVQATGQSVPAPVVINISTPDVAGFRRSKSQIAAEMSRLMSHGQRNR